MERNNSFWAFLVVVLVLGLGGGAFSFYARNSAAEAHRARELELLQREKATKGLLESMIMSETSGGVASLRGWFETRFRIAWAQRRPNTEPPEELVLDALEVFQERMETIPGEIAKDLAGK